MEGKEVHTCIVTTNTMPQCGQIPQPSILTLRHVEAEAMVLHAAVITVTFSNKVHTGLKVHKADQFTQLVKYVFSMSASCNELSRPGYCANRE